MLICDVAAIRTPRICSAWLCSTRRMRSVVICTYCIIRLLWILSIVAIQSSPCGLCTHLIKVNKHLGSDISPPVWRRSRYHDCSTVVTMFNNSCVGISFGRL